MKKAEVTVYLSFVFILLITFTAGVMESASLQVSKNYKRADMNRAMESVFAEYQKELLEDYDIFSLEATYESGIYSEELLTNRLAYYGASNIRQDMVRIQFLTDQKGQAFYDQITYYMQQKYGLNFLSDKLGDLDGWRNQDNKILRYQRKEKSSEKVMEQALEADGTELSSDHNPIREVSNLKKSSLLELIMPKGQSISGKSVKLSQMVSKRSLNQGYGDFSDLAQSSGALSNLLFGEYLLEHFRCETDQLKEKQEEKEGALSYELEYLYAGKSSDRKNLESVAKHLLALRFVANYGFVRTSASKRAEAEAMALTLSTLALSPEAEKAVTEMILLAWAYGESIVDLRALMNGLRVPFHKSNQSWQLSLSGLLKLRQDGSLNDGRDDPSGMDYQEYLRMLLFLQNQKTLRMRALDVIEKNLQLKEGKSFFQADLCVNRMELQSTCQLRRGIRYQFFTYFGYN